MIQYVLTCYSIIGDDLSDDSFRCWWVLVMILETGLLDSYWSTLLIGDFESDVWMVLRTWVYSTLLGLVCSWPVDYYSPWIILFYLWNLTGYSFYIYLTTIMFMLLKFAGKILLHGNNTRMFTCYIFLLYRYPVTWHVVLLLYRYLDFHMLILLPWLPLSHPRDLSNMYTK